MSDIIKLSSPDTHEYWEVPILFEDEHLLAIDKPAGLLVSPDHLDPQRPSLMELLHHDIKRGAPWAKKRNLTYLMNAQRLDFETSGVLLLVKSKPDLVTLATEFGTEKPTKIYVALVRGVAAMEQSEFQTDGKLAPHPLQMGIMRIDPKEGKRSRTEFTVRERFSGYMLMECRPCTVRTHQVRVHLKHVGFKVVADEIYGGPPLMLSSLKPQYRLKFGQTERALIARVALHAEQLTVAHPVTGAEIKITAPWPRDFAVAVKYLRRYAAGSGSAAAAPVEASQDETASEE